VNAARHTEVDAERRLVGDIAGREDQEQLFAKGEGSDQGATPEGEPDGREGSRSSTRDPRNWSTQQLRADPVAVVRAPWSFHHLGK
jgi:hypothetical protein